MGCCFGKEEKERETDPLLVKPVTKKGRGKRSQSNSWKKEREKRWTEREESFRRREEEYYSSISQSECETDIDDVNPAAIYSTFDSSQNSVNNEEESQILSQDGLIEKRVEVEATTSVEKIDQEISQEQEEEEEEAKKRELARQVREEAIRKRLEEKNRREAAENPLEGVVDELEEMPAEEARRHVFRQHTYTRPSYCRHCCGFIFGVYHQGVLCSDCGFPAHDRCGELALDMEQCTGRFRNNDEWQKEISLIKEESKRGVDDKSCHRFQAFTFTTPSYCRHCCKFIFGVYKQGMVCSDCGYPSHPQCAKIAAKDCDNTIRTLEEWQREIKTMTSNDRDQEMDIDDVEVISFVPKAIVSASDSGEGSENPSPSITSSSSPPHRRATAPQPQQPSLSKPTLSEKGSKSETSLTRVCQSESDTLRLSQVAHIFQGKTFHRPTYCAHCLNFMYGVYNQGVKCRVCNYPAHHQCVADISPSCGVARPPKEWIRIIKEKKELEKKKR